MSAANADVLAAQIEADKAMDAEMDGAVRTTRKNTSFKITNIVVPINDKEDEEDDRPDSSGASNGNGVANGNQSLGHSKISESGEPSIDEASSKLIDSRGLKKRKNATTDLSEFNNKMSSEQQELLLQQTASKPPLSMAWASFVICRGGRSQFVVSVAMANETTLHAGPKDRFKVVKIAEKEAVAKGRWKCFDFADRPIPSATSSSSTATTATSVDNAPKLLNTESGSQHQQGFPGSRADVSTPSSMTSAANVVHGGLQQQQPRPVVQQSMSQSSGLPTAPVMRPVAQPGVPVSSADLNNSNKMSQFASHPQFSQPQHFSTPNAPHQAVSSMPLAPKETYTNHPVLQPFHIPDNQSQGLVGVEGSNNSAFDTASVASVGSVESHQLVERLEEIEAKNSMGQAGGGHDVSRILHQTGAENGAANGEDIESTSESNQGAIDNRIEQAMDLVKSHLMSAVRSEVEELKDKIASLEETIARLQTENDFLRSHVQPDVILQLQAIVHSNNQQQQQQSQPPHQQQQIQQQQQPQHEQQQQPQLQQPTPLPQQQQQPQPQQIVQQKSGSATPIQK